MINQCKHITAWRPRSCMGPFLGLVPLRIAYRPTIRPYNWMTAAIPILSLQGCTICCRRLDQPPAQTIIYGVPHESHAHLCSSRSNYFCRPRGRALSGVYANLQYGSGRDTYEGRSDHTLSRSIAVCTSDLRPLCREREPVRYREPDRFVVDPNEGRPQL